VRLGLQEGEAIIHPWINKAIEKAQHKVEARNYDIRKQLLQYDDVMNDQRKVVYEQRRDIMESESVTDIVNDMRAETVNALVSDACPPNSYPEQWNVEGLKAEVERVFGLPLPIEAWVQEEAIDPLMLEERISAAATRQIEEKIALVGDELWRQIEKSLLLQAIDQHWKEHLATLDALRQVIHLRAYAQRNPLNEYKSEAFALFERMLVATRAHVSEMMSKVQFQAPPPLQMPEDMVPTHIDPFTGENDAAPVSPGFAFGAVPAGVMTMTALSRDEVEEARKVAEQYGPSFDPEDPATWEQLVSRNAPCPCGSGRKYKHCHGRD